MSDIDPTTRPGWVPAAPGPRRPARARTAYLVRPLPLDPTALAVIPHTASLYRLDPPMRYPHATYGHVIVLAQDDQYGPRTLVYGANAAGEIVSLGDVRGSYDGGMDHQEALRRAGYEVAFDA